MSADEKRIREFAYQIWESEGRPHGQDARHWEMARKLAEAEALAPDKTAARSASKPKLPKVDGPADTKPAAKPKTASAAKPAAKAAAKPAAKPKPAPAAASGETAKPAAVKKPRKPAAS